MNSKGFLKYVYLPPHLPSLRNVLISPNLPVTNQGLEHFYSPTDLLMQFLFEAVRRFIVGVYSCSIL